MSHASQLFTVEQYTSGGFFMSPDERFGALPVACVVREVGHTLTEEGLRQWSIEHGPAYAHTRAVWFVEEIPLAGTAKIDQSTLALEAASRFTPR